MLTKLRTYILARQAKAKAEAKLDAQWLRVLHRMNAEWQR